MKSKFLKAVLVCTILASTMCLITGCKLKNSESKNGSAEKLFEANGNDTSKIHIGDYVAYDEGDSNVYSDDKHKNVCKTTGTSKWRVLGIEDGKIKLVCDDSVYCNNTKYISKIEADFVNNICAIYGNGEGAEKARSINWEDINQFFKLKSNEQYDKNFADLFIIPSYYLDETSTEYSTLFKNENDEYKTYVIADSDGKCREFQKDNRPQSSNYSIEKEAVELKRVLPVVILKADVNITGKDSNGVWQIENTNKKYKENTIIEISSADDLVKLTEKNADLKGNYKLTQDIDLSNVTSFAQIANGGVSTKFQGVFDGNNHTITGINISSENDNIGFFQKTDKAVIKNLTIKNVKVESNCTKGSHVVAGILIGDATDTKIINCNVSGSINGKEAKGSNEYGLLIGNGSNTDIINCNISGDLTANYAYECGGIAGTLSNSYVERCSVNANIKSNFTKNLGGCIGTSKGNTIIKTGTNGTIELTESGEECSGYIGAFIGDAYRVSGYLNANYIIQCFAKNNIKVTAEKSSVSGFISGFSSVAYIFDCYFAGSIDSNSVHVDTFDHESVERAKEYNCYTNPSSVKEKERETNTKMQAGKFYYNKDVVGAKEYKESENVIALTKEEFAKKESFKDFDFDNIWKWNSATNTPVLAWEK